MSGVPKVTHGLNNPLAGIIELEKAFIKQYTIVMVYYNEGILPQSTKGTGAWTKCKEAGHVFPGTPPRGVI